MAQRRVNAVWLKAWEQQNVKIRKETVALPIELAITLFVVRPGTNIKIKMQNSDGQSIPTAIHSSMAARKMPRTNIALSVIPAGGEIMAKRNTMISERIRKKMFRFMCLIPLTSEKTIQRQTFHYVAA